MAYQVDKFNGTFLVSVADGTIDTTTDLRFLGKNYAGYGEVQNENFLHLLENFANTSAPPKAITGQIWFDANSTTKKLKYYDGAKWKTAGGAEFGSSQPSGLTTGDFWFDTSAKQLYAYNGSGFTLIGPEASPDLGASAVSTQVVKDTSSTNHTIVKFTAGSQVTAIVSKDEFRLNDINPITGFSLIKKGITLIDTAEDGITGSTEHRFWGTASNSLLLGGLPKDAFVQIGNLVFNEQVLFKDPGFAVGDQSDLAVYVENSNEPVIENQLGGVIKVRIRVSASDARDLLVVQKGTGNGEVIPGATNQYTLGRSDRVWSSVYSTSFFGTLGSVAAPQIHYGDSFGIHKGDIKASNGSTAYNSSTREFTGSFNGTLSGNVIGNVTGTASSAQTLNNLNGDTVATINTVALRDTSGNLTANRFIGIADKTDRMKISETATDTDPNYRSAVTSPTPNTVAARDALGNLSAVYFNGTATSAHYADLAEKYLADADYEVGTVVMVGGEKEVTACTWGSRAIGTVSENPAFMMNKDLEGGTYIALKGRVPVKVSGSVKKGDRLVASNGGVAVPAVPHANDVFAIALETNTDTGVKVIEAIIL